MKMLSYRWAVNNAICTFDVMDETAYAVASLQPAHHCHNGTRPGASDISIDDSFASQPVAETTLVFSILVIIPYRWRLAHEKMYLWQKAVSPAVLSIDPLTAA